MRGILPVLLSVLLLAAFFGCDSGSGPISPGLPSIAGPDLDDEYGGYTFSDEPPAFGDLELFAQGDLDEDTEFNDEMEDDPGVKEIVMHPNACAYMLRIEWGKHVRLPEEDAERCRNIVLDWTGQLRLDRGAIILKRLIKFEANDYIHEREDRRLLEWTSHTSSHIDGILVKIMAVRPTPRDSSVTGEAGPNHLTFRTAPYSRTFTTDELEHLDEMIPVDRCGNAISFTAFRIPSDPCPHGFLAGIWKSVSADTIPPDSASISLADTADGGKEILGHFYGNWIQANGMLAGHLRGVYGLDSEGRHVFFGKYIDLSGNFKGILRGRYGSMSMGPFADTAGWFQGEWIDEEERVAGRLKGHWVAPHNSPKGFFHGRWGRDCYRGSGGHP